MNEATWRVVECKSILCERGSLVRPVSQPESERHDSQRSPLTLSY